jgi:protoheme IX farnesyltransferase
MMQRTEARPLPSGRLLPAEVLSFGLLFCILGFYIFALFVNLVSALLVLGGILYYVLFYSLLLKHSTPQNIVIGGGAGAIPPLVGWAAATGSLNMAAFFLFAIVFFWTPPHFWALALLRSKDYARAGIPMMPVVLNKHRSTSLILLYSIQLVLLTFLLPLVGLGGVLTLTVAALLGSILLLYSWQLWRGGGNRFAWRLYRYSSMYLAVLFAVLVLDTLLH